MATRKIKVWIEAMVEVDADEIEERAPQLWPEQQTELLIQSVQESIRRKNIQLTQNAIIPKDAHASNEDYSSYLTEPENEFSLDYSILI